MQKKTDTLRIVKTYKAFTCRELDLYELKKTLANVLVKEHTIDCICDFVHVDELKPCFLGTNMKKGLKKKNYFISFEIFKS